DAPGTLLLAEAFWLLEGSFVRTLGMHRVYNSAFMNMLRDEDNAGYRMVIRNTVEFDPAILGRFVNFMSNPDEKTAAEQFGTGDKYFGVAALLATMPGLPMFGHGQVEGLREQYGMEFRRARFAEPTDSGLLAHHERTIFPLLHRRAEFAGSDGFRLYDFETAPGQVNEDVFVYSNRGPAGEHSLVLFHNRYAQTSGRARLSCTFGRRTAGGELEPVRETIVEGLGLTVGSQHWLVMVDAMTGLEELRSTSQVAAEGFAASLAAYGCRVYVNLREVVDGPGTPWSRLGTELAGRAVPSLDDALAELVLEPEHAAVRSRLAAALETAGPASGARAGVAPSAAAMLSTVASVLRGTDIDGLRLAGVIRATLAQAGLPDVDLDRSVGVVLALAGAAPGLVGLGPSVIRAWFADPVIRAALRVHAWEGGDYFEREAWELWLAVVALTVGRPGSRRQVTLVRAGAATGYRVDRLLAAAAVRPRPERSDRADRPGPGRAGATGRASRGSSSPRGDGAG
ncbi:MAG: alpha-amylase family glycosyl hydrolase, partial [Candidatus Limnocylindrales bacterium]